MLKKVGTNDCSIEVTPNSPWLGERTAESEYRTCKNMEEAIKRHVDDVGSTFINQKYVWSDERGGEWKTLYDALEELFDEEGCRQKYILRYERPSDNGTGTRNSVYSFEKLVEQAWLNPWKFEYISGPDLNQDQWTFLNRVVEESIKEKTVKEV